jgi:hypothetical protein
MGGIGGMVDGKVEEGRWLFLKMLMVGVEMV